MRRLPSPGFTLVETLVALVLFIIAIGGLAEATNDAIHSLNLLEIKEGHGQDYSYVRSQVFAITDIDTMQQGGTVQTADGGEADWSANVNPTQTADLYAVNLTIKLPGGDGVEPEQDTRTYYLLRPSFTTDPDDRTALLQQLHDQLGKVRTAQAWP
jgi:type II secretory pathway pseudopilin PulG